MNQPGLELLERSGERMAEEPAFVAAPGVFAVEPVASVSLEPELQVARAVPAGAADNMAVLEVAALPVAVFAAVEPAAVRSLQEVPSVVLAGPEDSAEAGSGAAAVYSAILLFRPRPA